MSDASGIIRDILEFIKEMEVYEGYKEQLKDDVKKINAQYQNRSFGYLEYEAQLKTVLKDKSEEEWAHYYNAYLFSLIKKTDFLLAQLYGRVYEHKAEIKTAQEHHETAFRPAAVLRKTEKKTSPPEATSLLDEKIAALRQQLKAPAQKGVFAEPKTDARFAGRVKKLREKIREKEELAKAAEQAKKETIQSPAFEEFTAEKGRVQEKVLPEKKHGLHITIFSLKSVAKSLAGAAKKSIEAAKHARIKLPAINLKHWKAAKPAAATQPAAAKTEKPVIRFSLASQIKNIASRIKSIKPMKTANISTKTKAPLKKQRLFVEEIVGMEKTQKNEKTLGEAKAKILFVWPLGKQLLEDMLSRFRAKQEPIMGPATQIPTHMKKLREMRQSLYEEARLGGLKPTLMAEEAHRVKTLLAQVEKPQVYKGSSIGLIANVSVKKISLWLVDTFPEFFGYLYNALRAANVKILSNTYVNIMILCTIGMFGILSVALVLMFFILGHPIYQIFLRSLIFSLFGAGMCATTFYLYPFIKIKDRRKSITTNMPFAINHVASVAASGVPPASMFELISYSKEYGEVAVEIKKIVDFVKIFGYDLLTAIKSVAATTPSIEFKEFLEGMVSTIETGGDLESYLKQKAQESTTKYQLERQRYNETISTYSDLYTGLLIAAPLFFIATLALINMLGGNIWGMSVDIMMALGAYIVIPALNAGFLAFLQMNQPAV